MGHENHEHKSIKSKLRHEIIQFLIIFSYLGVFFSVFAWHQRLVLDEYHLPSDEWWVPLIEAAVLAKVIMIMDLLKLGRRHDRKPLIVPTLYKTVIFGAGIACFVVLEATVRELIKGHGMLGGWKQILHEGADEHISRIITKVFALVPFFAIREVSRVLGEGRLAAMFFRETHSPERAASH